jgi:hypothetical protein
MTHPKKQGVKRVKRVKSKNQQLMSKALGVKGVKYRQHWDLMPRAHT